MRRARRKASRSPRAWSCRSTRSRRRSVAHREPIGQAFRGGNVGSGPSLGPALAGDFGRWSAGTTAANAIIILGHPDMGFLMPTAVTYASSWSAGRPTLEAARRRLAPDPSARLWTNSIGTTRGLQMATGFSGVPARRAREFGAFFLGELARYGGVQGLPSCGRDIAGAVPIPDLSAGASARHWGGVGSAPAGLGCSATRA
jgi:hypothetical protein